MAKTSDRVRISFALLALGVALIAVSAWLEWRLVQLLIIGAGLSVAGIAGLLGLNILWDSPLDQDLDDDLAPKTPIEMAAAKLRREKQRRIAWWVVTGIFALPALAAVVFLVGAL